MRVPVPARPAATLVLVRDGPPNEDASLGQPNEHETLEVLLVRRNERADFVGGAHVFPGGGVDGEDGSADVAAVAVGRTDREASVLLGLIGGGLAYWVAAVRECFEEAGILFAYGPTVPGARSGAPPARAPDTLVSLADPVEQQRLLAVRSELNGGRRTFLDVCRSEGLRLALDQVHYLAHWITPEPSPRRYDTRFFVAGTPPDQVPQCDAREIVEESWVRPYDALRRHRDGEIDLVYPTVRTLQTLSAFHRAADVLAAAANASGSADRPARMVSQGRGLRIVLPGDAEGVDDGPGGSG
jgi:8-oxo-dGTP pyrophosphatase MutT (NUDIX family)